MNPTLSIFLLAALALLLPACRTQKSSSEDYSGTLVSAESSMFTHSMFSADSLLRKFTFSADSIILTFLPPASTTEEAPSLISTFSPSSEKHSASRGRSLKPPESNGNASGSKDLIPALKLYGVSAADSVAGSSFTAVSDSAASINASVIRESREAKSSSKSTSAGLGLLALFALIAVAVAFCGVMKILR